MTSLVRGVADDGAGRDVNLERGAVAAVLSLFLVPLPPGSALFGAGGWYRRAPRPFHGAIREEHDIAAAASVASVGAAARDELLPVEADQAVPTVPRRHVYICTVNHACQSPGAEGISPSL